MSFRMFHRLFIRQLSPNTFLQLRFLCIFAVAANAASIRGVVTDASGARITGATVDLLSSGQIVVRRSPEQTEASRY